MKYTKAEVRQLVDALPPGYYTRDLDAIIARLVRQKTDVSALRAHVLAEQDLHRIYYYVNLKQIRDVDARMAFIDRNLLFSDWWHTDQLISFVADLAFDKALEYARRYVQSADPFVRRWGYVLFISRLGRGHAGALLPLMKDDDAYYVQMGEAWLAAELAIDEPAAVYAWMQTNDLAYRINGKAIQKICDSFRISAEWKTRFKALRPALKTKPASDHGMKTLLLTAFAPFGGEKWNSAMDAMQCVPAQIGGLQIVKLTVPTVFGRSVDAVTAEITRLRPDAVLMLGQAGSRDMLTPERAAVNWIDARIPDNAGKQPMGVPVVPGGPDRYFSTLPTGEMVKAIQAAGVPAKESEDAGRFVCNQLFYGVLHFLAGKDRQIPAGFLHLPRATGQAQPAQPSLPLAQIVEGVCAAISAIAAPCTSS